MSEESKSSGSSAGGRPPDDTVRSLLAKLRTFTEILDDDERRLFAALIGPGVEAAVERAEVEGFSAGVPEFDRLERGLAALAQRDQPGGGSALDSE